MWRGTQRQYHDCREVTLFGVIGGYGLTKTGMGDKNYRESIVFKQID